MRRPALIKPTGSADPAQKLSQTIPTHFPTPTAVQAVQAAAVFQHRHSYCTHTLTAGSTLRHTRPAQRAAMINCIERCNWLGLVQVVNGRYSGLAQLFPVSAPPTPGFLKMLY